jgi:hypothetical protein
MKATVKALFVGGPLNGEWKDVDPTHRQFMAAAFTGKLWEPEGDTFKHVRYEQKVFARHWKDFSGTFDPYGVPKVRRVYIYQCEDDAHTDDELANLLDMAGIL